MIKKIEKILEAFCLVVTPPPSRTISEWADQERILPAGNPEAGQWRSSRTPYMIEVMNAFDDPRFDCVYCSCGSQMGKSEIMLNIFGKRLDDGIRVPCLMVQPNEKLTRSFSNDRVSKMLDTADGLKAKLDYGHSNKVTEKFIAGIRWGFAWAGSPTELASHPIGLAICDEVDRYGSAVSNEGDPVVLVSARLKNFHNSKLGCFSTPTTYHGSKITALWYTGTMGMWSWVCPHCKERFVPKSKYLEWESGATTAKVRAEAYLACPSCGVALTDLDKIKMNKDGAYLYHTLDLTDDDEKKAIIYGLEPPENRNASYWISGLASPWQSFGELAEQLVNARRSKDEETIKACLNVYFGEYYKQKGTGHKWQELRGLIGQYRERTVPEDVQFITLGADVQKLGIYYTVRGWGFNAESWKIENGYINGETEFKPVWDLFANVIDTDYSGYRIKRAFVDSGFNTSQVYHFCRRFPSVTFPTKGQDGQARPLMMSKVDLTIAGKIKKGGIKLFHLDTHYFKSWLYARFKWPSFESGAFHFNEETTDDYLKQITAEQLLINKKGGSKWEQIRADNHYLDCEVGALGSAISLEVHHLHVKKEDKDELRPKKKRKSRLNKRKGLF